MNLKMPTADQLYCMAKAQRSYLPEWESLSAKDKYPWLEEERRLRVKLEKLSGDLYTRLKNTDGNSHL